MPQYTDEQYLAAMEIVGKGAEALLEPLGFSDSETKERALTIAWAAWKRFNPPSVPLSDEEN